MRILPAMLGVKRARLEGLLVVAVAALTFGLLEAGRHELWCADGYYHIRSAQILRTHGISRTFPWWQETFLRDHWADKDFLYHLLLVPFTFGHLVIGAKAAAVVFATGTIATFHHVLRVLRAPGAAWFTLALMAFSPMLLARLAFPRGFVLAIALSLAGTAAIFCRRERLAAGLAAAYAWTHISYHLLPCIALVYDLLRPREDGRRSFRMTAWTVSGMTAGVVVNPYFPNNLRLWWVQNVDVLWTGWEVREDLRLGQELLPPAPGALLATNAGIFVCFAGALGLLARRKRLSPEGATVLLVASGFLALTLRSTVFLEFAFPFAILFAAIVWRDAGVRLPRVAAAALGVAALALAAKTTATMVDMAPRTRLPDLWGAAAYVRDHVPDGETVFHADWDEFPQLYFVVPGKLYLVGLDPTFMLVTDAARWRLYHDVAYGLVADAYAPIRRGFRSRYLFATADDLDLLRVARRDPRFLERYRDHAATVFELADDDRPPLAWDIRHARVATDGFVDLAAALGLPDDGGDRCAVATAEIGGPGQRTLGIASDDEIRVELGGIEIYARSPRRSPRAGVPGGPPLAFEDLDRTLPDTAEREVEVTLAPGPNRIVVEDCRLGEDFGFFLRLR
jgi:hypothetical protein